MKKILLVSMFQNVAGILPEIEPDLRGKRITYIPTASRAEPEASFAQEEKQELKRLGLTVDELEISCASFETIQRTLKKNELIFVAGGNTFFLMQELKRTGADRLIRQEAESGKLYIGESAGAIAACPDIGYCAPMDEPEKAPGLKETGGLGLVDFYVVPHEGNPQMGEAARQIAAMYGESLDLKILNDSQAIVIQGADMQILDAARA